MNPHGNVGAGTLHLNGGAVSATRAFADGGSGASMVNLNGGTALAP